MIISTYGYRSWESPQALAKHAQSAGVCILADLRERAEVRGLWHKGDVRLALEKRGVDYYWLKKAGNPFRRRSEPVDYILGLYKAHIISLGYAESIARRVIEIELPHIAFLCACKKAEACHRSVFATLVRGVAVSQGLKTTLVHQPADDQLGLFADV